MRGIDHDPIKWALSSSGLGTVFVAAREGIEHLRADELDDCC